MLAPIGTQAQLRCSVVEEYSVEWIAIDTNGVIISSVEPGALESHGIIPTSITAQESVLTVNGTEDINGTTIQCLAILLTDMTMRCPSEGVLMIFYGMNMHKLDIQVVLSFVSTCS